uniref:hypothetical protein n=1 Tax=Neisseria sicca TaxID=490 RepID=UPI001C9991B9
FERSGMFEGVGMGEEVGRLVVGIGVITGLRIGFRDEGVGVVIVEMEDGGVGGEDGLKVWVVGVVIRGKGGDGMGVGEERGESVGLDE